MNAQLRSALATVLSHFDGSYNSHRYKNRGMPLKDAVAIIKEELNTENEIASALEELAAYRQYNDAVEKSK